MVTRTRCSVCLGSGRVVPLTSAAASIAGQTCLTCGGSGWLELEQPEAEQIEGLHGPSLPYIPPEAPPVPKDHKEKSV